MKCPQCGHPRDKVMESRQLRSGSTIRRRRQCTSCEFRFTSYEHIEHIPVIVLKKNGKREHFDLKKIRHSMIRTTEGLGIKKPELETALADIQEDVSATSQTTHEIRSIMLSKIIQKRLGTLNPKAQVRYTAFYGQYSTTREFIKALENHCTHPAPTEPSTRTGEFSLSHSH